MSTSINLKMKTATNKDISQAITDIDPNASASDLKGLAQGLVSLTTNTLVTTSKITKEDIPMTIVATKFTLLGSLPSFATKVDDYNYNISLAGLNDDFTDNGFNFNIGDSSGNTYAVDTSSFTVSQQTASTESVAVPISMEWGTDGNSNYNSIYFVKDASATADVTITIKYPGGTGSRNSTYYNLDSTYITFTVVE